ncbi:hypothetical protein R3P38DRAFT_2810422 [Favolaschia claudopus]|uniref:Uncharacterized protein n=1 Tax=Favolaschia claudopus TaxID=2862362 RepID=A0AAV9ZAR9_9AGAR
MPIEAIRNPARQHQSRDVKVGDNPTAQMLNFGKEIEEHTIQQGGARVNKGMQQDIGELATQTSPLSLGDIAWNADENPGRLATVTENAVPHSLQRVPKSAGIRVGTGSVGGNPEGHQFKHLPIWLTWWNSEGQAESGGASHLTPSYGNGECMHAFRATGASNHWNLSRLWQRGKESSPHQFLL